MRKKSSVYRLTNPNELANFGAQIYMPKRLFLWLKNIPLRILNTFNPENDGTLITSEQTQWKASNRFFCFDKCFAD